MATSKIVLGFFLAGTLAACGGEQAPPAPAAGEAIGAAPVEAAPAAATATGPIDGVWRCKMNGDIPLGTLTFTGMSYAFQTTNTAWEPNPNSADGSGTVTFNENFVLPDTGPLKDQFEVTGAFGDGSFINFNTDLGMMFGCRRP